MALVHGAQEPLGVRDGLVLYLDAANARSYPRTGLNWFDRSGNGNNGTLTSGPTYSSANFGSLVFDGTNDEVTTTTQFSNPQTYSIGAWFKTSTASGKKIVGFEIDQTGTGSNFYDRLLYIGTDGKIYFGVFDTSNNTTKTASSPSTYADNNWHNIVGTYDSGGTTMELYVDGVSVDTETAITAISYSGYWRIASYALGGWTSGSNGYFTGNIAQVSIYNRALTATEVAQNYNALRGRFSI
jgi:hypothetical protein